MRTITITIFKPSGKFYSEEKVQIGKNFINNEDEIIKQLDGRYKGMIIAAEYYNEVPFLITDYQIEVV